MTQPRRSFLPYRDVLLYGLVMAVLVFSLKWMQWKFIIVDNSLDIYVGLIALFFTALGVWIARQVVKPKVETVVVEKEVRVEEFRIDEAELQKLGSRRETEVLQLVSKGYSNAEIAESLCLSLSTVKTHVSGLLLKMDVKSRAQAIEMAKRLRLTA
jgi:DNA-binding CsgD family transcriptional regulator